MALALGGAACGGEDEEAGEDAGITVVTDTTSDEATTDGTTTDDLDTTGLEAFASDECLELISVGAALAQAFTGTADASAQESSELYARLVDKAPSEIRADLEAVAAGYAEYVDALRGLDLQSGGVPSAEQLQEIQAAIASIDQPGLQAAAERLSTWAQANCSSS